MKLLRYVDSGRVKPGCLDDSGNIRSLESILDDIGGAALSNASVADLRAIDVEGLPVVTGEVDLAPCIADVGKFICVGLNFSDHAAESGLDVPDEPVLFSKATSAICGPNDNVIMPRNGSKLDWEVELGVVIGEHCHYASPDDAVHHIAGYCVINDVSERKFQLEISGGQWDKGKGCDTFGPIGPWLVTKDEIDDVNNLEMWLDVNGQRRQRGNTRTMVFDAVYLVSYISQFMSLQAGDIISTGTPPGVGLGMDPPQYLQEGDVMTLGIDHLGTQSQTVVAAAPADSEKSS